MTPPFRVQSILALTNAFPDEKQFRDRRIKKPTDSKIQTIVLQQIGGVKKSGALFPSATAPKIVIGFLSAFRLPIKLKGERPRLIPSKPSFSRLSISREPSKGIPIGLCRSETCHWLNSLLQFLLFLPGSWELFSLIPRKFQPLREFADQYFADRDANRPVSSADSSEIFSLFPKFLKGNPDLYDLLSGWMQAIFPDCPFTLPGEIHPALLHPEWHVVAGEPDFEEALQNTIRESPPEILIGLKGKPFFLKGHFFASSAPAVSYDLDAFIEMRPDGEHGENYIAYLKRDGVWYQCDDERVIQFRSNCLNAPLRRATLLHYKRVDLAGRNPAIFQK